MVHLDPCIERPALSAQEDGLGDVCIGLSFLGFALLIRLQAQNGTWGSAGFMPMLVLLIFGPLVLACHFGTRWLRRRAIHARAALVPYRRRAGPWTLVFGAASALGAGAAAVAAARHVPELPLAGVGIGIALLYVYWRFRFSRHVALAAVSLAMGAGLGLQGIRVASALTIYFLVMGGAELLTGAAAFAMHTRRMRPAGSGG